jgi:lipopolysaccharide transport system ATP-binding protein
MAKIHAENVTIEYPLYQAQTRSLKNAVLKAATGGIFARAHNDVVVVRALENIDFKLSDGDRLGIVGHNGSGKTTLLRTLSGVYAPIRGQLDIEGRVVSMVNISLGLDGEATGLENIYLRGTLLGYSHRKIKGIVDDICTFAELGDFIRMPLRIYSSGMAMRLAFAISTTIDADIILMDEWLSVGDAAFSVKAQERINSFVNKAGILVIASHDKNMIDKMCNKVIELEHGQIKARLNI